MAVERSHNRAFDAFALAAVLFVSGCGGITSAPVAPPIARGAAPPGTPYQSVFNLTYSQLQGNCAMSAFPVQLRVFNADAFQYTDPSNNLLYNLLLLEGYLVSPNASFTWTLVNPTPLEFSFNNTLPAAYAIVGQFNNISGPASLFINAFQGAQFSNTVSQITIEVSQWSPPTTASGQVWLNTSTCSSTGIVALSS
jgi:hypothetical protein